MSTERYLNHPTFGLLYRVAEAGEGRDLYATLYAQRMFFVVTLQERGAQFEVLPLMDARHLAEQNLARARREGFDDGPLLRVSRARGVTQRFKFK